MAAVGNTTRRAILRAIPAISTVVVAPIETGAAAVAPTPLERFKAAVAELKASAEALDGTIYEWVVNTNGDMHCGLLIAAYRTTTKYDGDGWYERTEHTGTKSVVRVQMTDFDWDGTRWLRVTPWPAQSRKGSKVITITDFATQYGKKIS